MPVVGCLFCLFSFYPLKSYGCCALHIVLCCLYLYEILWTYLEWFFKLQNGHDFVTETATYKVQRDVTKKVS